jgi:hypothetical protein
MASNSLFDKLFIFPKERINLYIGPHLCQLPIEFHYNDHHDISRITLHAVVVRSWENSEIDGYAWSFTMSAWDVAEVHKNQIFIEDTNGDEIILNMWRETEFII